MSKVNLPIFLLTGVPLTESKSSGPRDWVDIVVPLALLLLMLCLAGFMIFGIVSAFMWQGA